MFPNWQPEQADSPHLLRSLRHAKRPIELAGCATKYAEQKLVLDAFVLPRGAVIVIAPSDSEHT